jgi:hypothetical protein
MAAAPLGFSGAAAGPPAKPDLDDIVPKRIHISVAADHLFGVTELHVWPKDVGADSWARWDRDGDGKLSAPEQRSLFGHILQGNLPSQVVATSRRRVDWGSFAIRRMAKDGAVLSLDQAVDLKISGRLPLARGDRQRAFVVYAPPRSPDGIVPLRISLAEGLTFSEVAGSRAEQRGPRRIEAVLSRASPALWGIIRRAP